VLFAQPVTLDVLATDWDAEIDPLVIDHASNGKKGDVRVNADGTIIYTPGKSFKGRDKFMYTISDGLASSTAAVTITSGQGR
jgi:hypothetical protein